MKNKSDVFLGPANKDDKQPELVVQRPSAKDNEKAKAAYNIALKKALDGGALFAIKLQQYLRDQKIWDDEKDRKLRDIFITLDIGEKKLEKGGIKLSEAREIAIGMAKARRDYITLMSEYNSIEANTAESVARDAEFNAKVALCTVYNDTGKPYYSSIEAYLEDNSPTATLAANALASLLYNLGESDRELPENRFLLKYKLVNEELKLINKDGKFVDEDGNLVDELGRRVNENNEPIDKDGNIIKDEEVTFTPFLDDDGQPVE